MPGMSSSSAGAVIADALVRARADGTRRIGEQHLFAALMANPDSRPLLGGPDEAEAVWAAAGHAHTVFPTSFAELIRITSGTAAAVGADEPAPPGR